MMMAGGMLCTIQGDLEILCIKTMFQHGKKILFMHRKIAKER